MRQGQSRPPIVPAPPRRAGRGLTSRLLFGGASRPATPAKDVAYVDPHPWIAMIESAFSLTWFVITLPFRLVFGVVSLVGRATGVTVGFGLMVVGMALGAGPFYLIGVPLFLVGLLLTLKCLG